MSTFTTAPPLHPSLRLFVFQLRKGVKEEAECDIELEGEVISQGLCKKKKNRQKQSDLKASMGRIVSV